MKTTKSSFLLAVGLLAGCVSTPVDNETAIRSGLEVLFAETHGAERYRIAVLPLVDVRTERGDELGSHIAADVMYQISAGFSDRIRMIECDRITELMSDLELDAVSGLISDEDIKKLGETAGADYLILGTKLELEGTIRADLRMVEVQSAEIRAETRVELAITTEYASLIGGTTDSSSAAVPSDVPAFAGVAALVTDVGGLQDGGYNASVHEGLERGVEMGFEMHVYESTHEEEYAVHLSDAVADGADIVFAVGYALQEAVVAAAEENPGTHFVAVDALLTENPPNLHVMLFREHESGFLAGVVAGYMTGRYADASARLNPANVVGIILGMDIPPVERFEAGFIHGVAYADPNVRVLSRTLGTFDDQGVGYAAAEELINEGADIVFQAAGLAGIGAIEAARVNDILAIGVDTDQNDIAPDTVLTSAVKIPAGAVRYVLREYTAGRFTAGPRFYGIAENAAGIASFHRFDSIVPEEVKNALVGARERVCSGVIKVAATRDEIAQFIE